MSGEVGYDATVAESVLTAEERAALDRAVLPGRGSFRADCHRPAGRDAALLLPLAVRAEGVLAAIRIRGRHLHPAPVHKYKEPDMSVMRLGYVHVRVTDLQEARNHYSNTLGMSVVMKPQASCTARPGTSTTTTPSSWRRAASGWSSSATRSSAPPTSTPTSRPASSSAAASSG